MTCVKCGREIPDGELFCPECSRGPRGEKRPRAERPETYPAAPKRGGARLAARPEKRPKQKAEPAPRPHSKGRTRAIWALSILLVLAMAAAAGAFAWISMNLDDLARQRNAYQVREADLLVREEAMAATRAELEETSRILSEAQNAKADLQEQLSALQEQLSGNENALYQTEYDMTTLQHELETMTEANAALAGELQSMEAQNTQLTEIIANLETDVETLTAERDAYQVKSDFLDAHVVFVENDGTDYYHDFECRKFVRKSYWCYSRRLAESRGYTPCPICGG